MNKLNIGLILNLKEIDDVLRYTINFNFINLITKRKPKKNKFENY